MSWIKEKAARLKALVLSENASPAFIARGWAVGMFYGCTIPFGFQIALSVPTAFLLKASRVGATFGTLITNHFTIFFIYPAQCWFGNRLLGGSVSYAAITEAFKDVLAQQSWEALMRLGGDLVAAFFLGGFMLAAVCTPLTYVGVLTFVRRHRQRRMEKKAHDA